MTSSHMKKPSNYKKKELIIEKLRIMPAIITPKECHDILRKLYEPHKNIIKVKSFQIIPLMEKSTGFFGIHSQLQIDIDFEKGNKIPEDVPHSVFLFAKALPKAAEHQQYINEVGAFKKEVNSFQILLPSMQKISESLGKHWAPECCLVRTDLLIFENLAETGFKNWKNTSTLLDFDHLVASVECLGYFHSSSFIFERRANELNGNFDMSDKFKDSLFESTFINDKTNVRYQWFEHGVETVIKMIKALDKYDKEEISKIEKNIPELMPAIKNKYKPAVDKINVVSHGDLWINNLMFKYDKHGKPTECRLVDFQLVRYAPNTLDLTCLAFLCSDKKTRDNNLAAILKHYMDAFNSQLALAGYEEVLFMDKIFEEFKSFKASAMMEACLFEMTTQLDEKTVEAMLQTPEDVQEFFYGDRSRFVMAAFKDDKRYRARMTELVEEFVETFVLV